MKHKRAVVILSSIALLQACESLDLSRTAEGVDESQRRAECYKQYRTLCPKIDELRADRR